MMPKIWLTSDTHFSHANIIGYCKRPFLHVNQMDDMLIKNWNSLVKADDWVYHLGDFAWGNDLSKVENYARRLNGIKYLIPGNHDPDELHEAVNLSRPIAGFAAVLPQVHLLRYGKKTKIYLSHYAMRTWPSAHKGSFQVYGHTHNNLPEGDYLSCDVGVDAWGFKPVLVEDVVTYLQKKQARLQKEGKDPLDPERFMKEKWDKSGETDHFEHEPKPVV